MIDKDIEQFVWDEISKYIEDIIYYSSMFTVDYKLIMSIIYVERIQSNLPTVRNFLKNTIYKLNDLIWNPVFKTAEESKDPLDWINCSRGLCHIKFETASQLVLKYKNYEILTDRDLSEYRTNPKYAIKFACAIIKEHILMWKDNVSDIQSKIDILGTLYNISDFKNKKPHNNPKSGGSILPLIIDGKYLENLNFGERVKIVYNSNSVKNFIKRKIYEK